MTLSAWVWEEISSLNMAGILGDFLGFYSSEDGEKREGRSKVLAKEATRAENGVVMIAYKARHICFSIILSCASLFLF